MQLNEIKDKKILLTGGTGYIGSHTYVSLVSAGYEPIILDNLSNSNPLVTERLDKITNVKSKFIKGDIRDRVLLDKIFAENKISAVIHFAGLKAVGESVQNPLDYYNNNVTGTLTLLAAMCHASVKTLIFSSSATVYGDSSSNPISENSPRGATNPYGRSKLMVENILQDLCCSDPEWNVVCLRYFNPVGAHESGLIGEEPRGIPNNLMPYVAQVAMGRHKYLNIFGADYPTPDGTGVRDYIHVMDLAEGHVAALTHLDTQKGWHAVNLGVGRGISVLQMIEAFEKASGKKIPSKILARRAGDIAECWADPTLAKDKLGWVARRSIADMCEDTWRWQFNNSNGFQKIKFRFKKCS